MKVKERVLEFAVSTLVLVAMTFFVGCKQDNEDATQGSVSKDSQALSVYAVNYPLQYFAERIGGPEVRVSFPASAEGDPAFWEPEATEIAAYQTADLILLNGASYAKWVPRVSLPASRLVDTSASFSETFIPLEDQVTHSHGLAGEHEHGDVAFTTWMDPVQALTQAQAVRDALIKKRPDAAVDFNQRFDALAVDLKALDSQIAAIVKTEPAKPLVFSHPVYQYFARRYGLNGQAVHWEPEESPAAEQWEALKQMLKDHPSKWMVWEGEPSAATVDGLEQIGLQCLTFDPCGNRPETGDYMSVMRENISNLKKAF
jgi:zinc transport system substrate-binding protein